MRSLIIVLVLSLAVAKKGKGKGEKEEGKGLCLTEENMMMICKAGSSLGERTMSAMETCSDNAMAEGRANKGKGNGKKPKPNKGKGKGKNKCPSVDKLEKMAMDEYADEICVFQELGWMDSDMNEMEEVIQADIDTLPTEIAEALKGEQYEACLAKAEEKMKNMMRKKEEKKAESSDEGSDDDMGFGLFD